MVGQGGPHRRRGRQRRRLAAGGQDGLVSGAAEDRAPGDAVQLGVVVEVVLVVVVLQRLGRGRGAG